MPVSRSLVAGLVLGALVACKTTAPDDSLPIPAAQPVFDSQIVPGQRIGPVALGMSSTQLLQAAGSPATSNHVGDVTAARFSNGIDVNVRDGDSRVTSVSTTESRYATPDGLRVGVSELEVRARRGAPAGVLDEQGMDRYLCYPGMWFGFARNSNRVNTIAVTAGTACTNARR